jgi:hypothetical protein
MCVCVCVCVCVRAHVYVWWSFKKINLVLRFLISVEKSNLQYGPGFNR